MATELMVPVVVKAANGAVSDFRVAGAKARWTVAELKNYLYRHYPTHPPVPSQKLIYRGQLLQGSQQLSDIVSDTDEQMIVHLVAYERSASAPAMRGGVSASSPASVSSHGEASRTDTEERESTDTTSTAGQGREPQAVAAAPPGHTLRYRPHPPHMQWFPGGHAPQNFPVGGAYPYPPFFMTPPYAGIGPAHPMQQWYDAYYARAGVVGGADMGRGGDGEDIDLPNLPDQAENPDPDQEDDLPMNAGAAGGMMLAGPQLQARRDLVDYSYMLLMATVLVSIAYFTSSFGRILLFLTGVLFMFLNQAGFFSLRRRPRNGGERGVDDLPDPLDRHRARQHAGQEAEEREGALAGAGETERDSTEEDTPDGATDSTQADPPPPPRPGRLTVAFTFITSLFTSLLPQQQPELQL